MPTALRIAAGSKQLAAVLNDCPTAVLIAKALPMKCAGNRWGGEIYFRIHVKAKLEVDNCKEVLEAGELGYWPSGNAFCIFFGETPASEGDEIRAASDVTIIGKAIGDVSGLWEVEDGAEIVLERAD